MRALAVLVHEDIPVNRRGVAVVLPGPKYETPGEIEELRAVRPLDTPKVVGMSGLELLYAHAAGYQVLMLATITNQTGGMQEVRAIEEGVQLALIYETLNQELECKRVNQPGGMFLDLEMVLLRAMLKCSSHRTVLAQDSRELSPA